MHHACFSQEAVLLSAPGRVLTVTASLAELVSCDIMTVQNIATICISADQTQSNRMGFGWVETGNG